MKKSNSGISLEIKSRPLTDDKGNVLSDYELAKTAIEYVDNYSKKTGKIAPLDPKFVEWLRGGVKYVDEGGGSFVDYKNNSIYKEFDYNLMVENTNARNDLLEKQGAFKPQIVKGG